MHAYIFQYLKCCLFIYVCVFACVYICMYAFMSVCIYAYTHTPLFIAPSLCIHASVDDLLMCTHKHIHYSSIHVCTHAYTCIFIKLTTPLDITYIHTCIYEHLFIKLVQCRPELRGLPHRRHSPTCTIIPPPYTQSNICIVV